MSEAFHAPDDRFVPIRLEDLVDAIEADPTRFPSIHAHVRAVMQTLRRVITQEVATFERVLDRRYAVFNPDRDTAPQRDLDRLREGDGFDSLRRDVHYLVTKANFEQLNRVQIESTIATARAYGFQVRTHPDRVTHLALYVRGRAVVPHRARSWRKPFRGEERELDVFQRMVVVVQLRDDPHVGLKLFREIPVADVEALLPHAEVLMSKLDRVLIIGGGAGALGGIATKLFWFLIGGAVVASQLLWPAIIAMGTLSVRSLLGYRRARHFRDSQRTRHLYERNLANNAAVLHTLLGSIGQEETKEAILAWAVLADATPPVADAADLGDRVERWLRERFEVTVRFDTHDAIESLDRLDLWADRARWRVVGPDEAGARLKRHFDERRTSGYHLDRAGEAVE